MADPQRTSDKHGPMLDDEMKQEVEGQVRSGRPTRAEEWHDPEPIEDENTPEQDELIERRREEEEGRTRDDAEEGGGRGGDDAARSA